MTREFPLCLTKNSAAYLRDAIGAVNRDSSNRHITDASSSLEAMQIAFDWQANQNETSAQVFLRNDKKRAVHIEELNAQFRARVNKIAKHDMDDKSWPESLEWSTHFPGHPTVNGVSPLLCPDNKKLKVGSFEHCLAWSDYNIQRVSQHRLTLAICDHLLMESHVFKHLAEPLLRAKSWVLRQKEQLDATRMQLILLEGDPAKIQALREEKMNTILLENWSVNHFYGHFNQQGFGSSEGDKRFRAEALRHVQAGLDTGAASANLNYSDLGLG